MATAFAGVCCCCSVRNFLSINDKALSAALRSSGAKLLINASERPVIFLIFSVAVFIESETSCSGKYVVIVSSNSRQIFIVLNNDSALVCKLFVTYNFCVPYFIHILLTGVASVVTEAWAGAGAGAGAGVVVGAGVMVEDRAGVMVEDRAGAGGWAGGWAGVVVEDRDVAGSGAGVVLVVEAVDGAVDEACSWAGAWAFANILFKDLIVSCENSAVEFMLKSFFNSCCFSCRVLLEFIMILTSSSVGSVLIPSLRSPPIPNKPLNCPPLFLSSFNSWINLIISASFKVDVMILQSFLL